MRNINILGLSSVIFYLICFCFGIIILITPLWKAERYRPGVLRWTTAFVMLLNIIDMCLWTYAYLFYTDSAYTSFMIFCASFDVITVISCAMIGQALAKPESFRFKDIFRFILPFFVMAGLMYLLRNIFLLYIDVLMCVILFVYMIPHQLSSLYHHEGIDEYSDLFKKRRGYYYRIMCLLEIQLSLYVLPVIISGTLGINPEQMSLILHIYMVISSLVWIYVVHCVLQIRDFGEIPIVVGSRLNTDPENPDMREDEVPSPIELTPGSSPVEVAAVKDAAGSSPLEDASVEGALGPSPVEVAPGPETDEAGEDAASTYDPYLRLWIDRLNEAMEEDKVYLRPDLTSAELARLVGTNRSYLSNYLNNVKHTTFYDYINGYRIREVAKLLEDKSLTMTEIAEKSGFSDVKTFRRVFKDTFGCLPSNYRR